MQRQGGMPAFVLVLIAVGVFGFVLLNNAQPTPAVRVIVPTVAQQPTEQVNVWQSVLEGNFGVDATPLPTVEISTMQFSPPTLELAADATAFAPADVGGAPDDGLVFSVASTPTRPPATIPPLETIVPVTEVALAAGRPTQQWARPPLIPPISRDVLGRDHFYFIRPVDSNATNRGLFYYAYGSDGPENAWRVHAGIDMPNEIGQTVRAAGSGMIVWAGPGFQQTFAYGNTVVIEHDFGHDGQRLYTLYAHLAAVLVGVGQRVEARDAIGLVGNTGRVTGPHVHFEVRKAPPNSTEIPGYGDTFNPVLWMVPYVGTGVIAGRVVDAGGRLLQDVDVTIRNFATGLNQDTTTTYIFQGTGVDVNPDPVWNENFIVGDLPVGRYEVIAFIDGVRVSRLINVIEGTTTFVELAPGTPPPSGS